MAVDDESIPHRPPFIAHISNLPYDVEESAIAELFADLKVTNLRLPREGDRLKGHGYVDFEDRENLIEALNMPDLTIGGRRVRIEVSTPDDRRMGRSGRSDRDRDYDPERTMGDWRSGPRAVPDAPGRPRPPNDRERDRDRDRERDSSADNRPGAWRDAERAPEPARAPYGGRDSFGRDRYGEDRGRDRGYGGRDGFRAAPDREGGFSRDSRGFGGRGFGDRDRDRDPPPREDTKPRERPKLNLLPRTVPRETEAPTKPADGAPLEEKQEKQAPKPVPAEKVFGGAKPVDTAAKEREIEERLRKQEEEARRVAEEKERWGGRRNDHSGDRRGGARRDDRGRDSRSFNRERRDYSKDDKDRRDDREKRDYRDDRDRRDYNRDSRDRRDPKDERERRDYTPDRRDPSPASPARRRDSVERDQERNGRPSRSRDRRDDTDEKPLPKLKEQEKPNFVASNKFSFLEDADDAASE